MDGISYTWDANGNLLHDGVRSYAYDHANRLTSVSGPTYTAGYRYNGLGDRLEETVDGVTTRFTLDLAAGLTQVLSDGSNTYLYGAGRIAQVGANGPEYFLGDALGSVRQLVDSSGMATLAKSYEPYGEGLSSVGSGISSYGFTGEWTDSYTGMIYLRTRWYAAGQGRFLTQDPFRGFPEQPKSLHRYTYSENNPVNFTDPSGRFIGFPPPPPGLSLYLVNLIQSVSGGCGLPGLGHQMGQSGIQITRVDTPKTPGEQLHAHFDNGAALNRDGTWKHGWTNLTKSQKEWLKQNGWELPKN